MAKKYLLGLDLGTNSIGWCVTDENDQIVKKGGKSLWGARLFEEASPASDRRMKRTNRRRLARRKQRIDLLQLLFKEEMDKVDPTFFLRLNESAYHKEDKDPSISSYDNLLFIDKDYTDRDYHREYPTIYHLRKALLEKDGKADLRLIYLAFAHMIKYRGNFLNEGQEIEPFDPDEGKALFNELNDALGEMEDVKPLVLPSGFVQSLKTKVVTARGINAKKDALVELFGASDTYFKNVVFRLIAGGKVATKNIFANDSDEEIEPKDIQFDDASYEENIGRLSETFSSSPELKMVLAAKKIFDFLLLGRLLGDSKTLSDSMVKRYERHKADLAALKSYVKEKEKGGELPKGTYNNLFRVYDEKTNNYVRYIGLTNTTSKDGKGKTRIRCSHCSRDDFYAYLKKVLGLDGKSIKVDELDPFLKDVYLKIDDKTYLERQNSSDNGVYPYQLNKQEMSVILEKQSKFYPFLSFKDAEGISTKEKIIKILEFKIPYYVGPLIGSSDTDPRGHFSWIRRKENEDKTKIYPWNFDKVVDKDASAENFIKRMLNKCTYLPDCYCLPKASILFQEYEVLSLLNKLTINGQFMSKEMKSALIENLFKTKAKVTTKGIENYLKSKTDTSVTISTSGGKEVADINVAMSSYVFFAKVLGKEYVDTHIDQIEDIIRDLTVFEDSEIVAKRLRTIYNITDKQAINAIKNKRLTGWGRLSRELLELKTPFETSDGEIIEKSLIAMMRDTNLNLMELINDSKFTFGKQIRDASDKFNDTFATPEEKHQAIIDFVDDSYVSPGMKRPLIQAMAIIEDVEKILRAPIDEYYVECTRSNREEKKQTKSRKEQLENLYKEAKKFANSEIEKEILSKATATLKDIDLGKFRSDEYYLYFLQMGRDLYSLEPIDLADINNYDIDHIVPRSLVKDDSISNRVLVHSSLNRSKSATYPLNDATFKCGKGKAFAFYNLLKKAGLMSEKKFAALTRSTPLAEEELTSFVNRQLVYTNQAVKALVSLIDRFQKDRNGKTPKVVYSKAENVSTFRQEYDIVKSRDANDFHHAHDAYLNICVGRAIATYFDRFVKYSLYGRNGGDDNSVRFLSKVNSRKASLNLYNVFDEYYDNDDVYHRSQLLDSDGGIVWDYSTFVPMIKKNIYCRFDVMTTTMQYIKGGAFMDATIHRKGDGLVPLKMSGPLSDTRKYGGKSSMKCHFFALVERVTGKKKNMFLASLPSMYCNPDDVNGIVAYLRNNGIECDRVINSCVRVNAVLKRGSSKVVISGVSGALKSYYIKNASQNYYSETEIKTIKKINKLFDFLSKQRTPVSSKTESWDKVEQTIHEYMVMDNSGIVISPAKDEKTSEIKLTCDELMSLYRKLMNIDQKHLSLLKGMLTVVETLNSPEAVAKFEALPIYAKAYQVMQIVQYFNSSIQRIDLSLLGGSGSAGGLSVPANLPSDCSIVVESPTGFFTKTLWKGC